MVGVKFLEDCSGGDSALARIAPGGSLGFQQRQFVGMDETFYTIQKVAGPQSRQAFNHAL